MSDASTFAQSDDDLEPSASSLLPQAALSEEEPVEGVVVLGPEHALVQPVAVPPTRALVPAVQAAAVAAGGFVAGAAIVGFVHRRHSSAALRGRRAGKGAVRRSSGRGAELIQIVGSRSLLVDVHLLDGPASRR